MAMKVKIVFVGEAYGEHEENFGAAMVGPTGIELFRLMEEAGLIQLTEYHIELIKGFWNHREPYYVDLLWKEFPQFHRTNVVNQRPPNNRLEHFCGGKAEGIPGFPATITTAKVKGAGRYLLKEFKPELDRLADELDDLNPNLVVALGNTATWALLGQTAISKHRGTTTLSTHTIRGFKVLPTYHPAAIFQNPKYRPIVCIDLMKAVREAEFPEIRRPAREIWVEPTLQDLENFYDRYICGCPILSVDIETSGKLITTIGFAPSPNIALVIPFFDPRAKNRSFWETATDECAAKLFVRRILEDKTIRKLFQNGLYDIAFLLRSDGIGVLGAEEDTMLLHHALQPESLKGLGFLGSVYTDEGSWKQMREEVETVKRDD